MKLMKIDDAASRLEALGNMAASQDCFDLL
jgi:hypothetical protein